MRENKTFTLIELLVVIAIIGILLSILLPSLSNAREKARIAVCASNLKQINVAITVYSNDNQNRFPYYKQSCVSWIGPAGASSSSQTNKPLNPYLKGSYENLAECPSAKGDYYKDWGTNYYNNTGWSQNTLGDDVKFLTETKDPVRMVQMYKDGLWWWIFSSSHGTWGTFKKNLIFHNQTAGKFNINFVDGHVKMQLKTTPSLQYTDKYTFNNEE